MKKAIILALAAAGCLILFTCQSTGGSTVTTTTTTTRTGNDNQGKNPPADNKSNDDSGAFKEMESYFENAGKKMDEMAVSEATSLYVAVLAIKSKTANPSPAMQALADKAQTELTKIEAGFLMQAGAEWLDANGNQIAASTYTAGKTNALNPKVLLFYNVGGSRIAVSAAPILFEFVKGSGLLTGFLSTNEYGEASVPLGKIDNPNKETVVRATLQYTVKGFTYRFASAKLEFVFLPPSKRAIILVYEKSDPNKFVAEDPYIFNTVYNALKKMDFEFIPYNAKRLGEGQFSRVFDGDLSAIRGLTLEQNIPYLVMVFNNCDAIRKVVEVGGFVAEGRSTLRIIRVADGKIIFEAVGYADRSHDNNGQGNTADKAMRQVFEKSSKAMEESLRQQSKEINKALGIE